MIKLFCDRYGNKESHFSSVFGLVELLGFFGVAQKSTFDKDRGTRQLVEQIDAVARVLYFSVAALT